MRILITGRNDTFPADAMQRTVDPRTAEGGPLPPPVARPRSATSCADLLLPGGRATSFLPGRRAPQLGRGLTPSAPSYDLTEGRWITPPPGKKPGAGAAAELRHAQVHTLCSGSSLELGRRASPTLLSGHLKTAVAECLTTAFGLLVFGLIAWSMLVLA